MADYVKQFQDELKALDTVCNKDKFCSDKTTYRLTNITNILDRNLLVTLL